VRCSEKACDIKTKSFIPVLWNIWVSVAQIHGSLCCSAVGAAVQPESGLGSIAGTFLARPLYRSDIASTAARGGSLEHCNHGTK
jgi:hypothetical protein